MTTKSGKFLKKWEYQTTLPASWDICMQVKKKQFEMDMKQLTGSKLGKKYIKAVYCHPAYLTHITVHHEKCQARWSTSGIKIAGRNANNLRYADNTTLVAESEEELKNLLRNVKKESQKAVLKLNIQKTKTMVFGPITHSK